MKKIPYKSVISSASIHYLHTTFLLSNITKIHDKQISQTIKKLTLH